MKDTTSQSGKEHKPRLIQHANGPSLEEINGTVEVPKGKGFWKTLFAYSGPGALVAVGYMDPGNWSTSITGGQNFQYLLMSVILMSSLIAMLLQYMAAKLGIVSQMDLAQAIRARTSKKLGIILWIFASMTAGSKINIFLACPFDALGQTMAPYAGQNIGARKLDRVGKGLRAACIIGFIVSGLMVIVVKLFGDQLTMLFLDEKDPVIMQNSTQFLIIVSAFYCLLTLVNTVRFTIQGMGFSSLAIIAGVMEMIARGIAGMLLVPAFGYLGACYSSPLAWLLADAFLIPAFFLCKRKVARQLEVGKA